MNKHINIKTIGKILAATIICFAAKTIAYADAVNIPKTVKVSATVGALDDATTEELSELEILSVGGDGNNKVDVGFGNISVQIVDSVIVSRYESQIVELKYLAARGPWDLLIYTDDGVNGTVDSQGLVGISAGNAGLTLPLKFSRLPLNNVPAPANDDANWSGAAAAYSFINDIDAVAVSRLTSSTETDAVGRNDSFKFVFGTDIISAAPGDYSADVIIELSMQ